MLLTRDGEKIWRIPDVIEDKGDAEVEWAYKVNVYNFEDELVFTEEYLTSPTRDQIKYCLLKSECDGYAKVEKIFYLSY